MSQNKKENKNKIMFSRNFYKKRLIQLWILFLFLSDFDTVAPSRPDDQYENLQHLMDERRSEFWNTFESDLYLNQLPTDGPSMVDSEITLNQGAFETSPSTESSYSFNDRRFVEEKQNVQPLFFSDEMDDQGFSMSSKALETNNDLRKGPKTNYFGSFNDFSSSKMAKRKSHHPINSKEEINKLKSLRLASSEWEFDDSPINNSSAPDGSFETNDGNLGPFSDSDERSYDDQNNKLRNLYWREETLQKGVKNEIRVGGDRRKSPDNLISKQRKRHRETGERLSEAGQGTRLTVQEKSPLDSHRSIQDLEQYPNENEELQSRKPNMYVGPLYTKWSKWSRCSKHCQQTRRRRCRVPSTCGSALIKESRPCQGWRCQHENFHLIQPEEIGPNYEATDEIQPAPRADVRVLLNYNSMFYTKWSQWSACSRTCLTSRYRSCRYPLFCGNAVIREEAYCYIQNTPCEKWYQRHKLGPDNKNGFDEKLNKVYYDLSSPLGQVQNNGTVANATANRAYPNQVVFGHNKFFTENLPVSPEDNAHILNINVGSSPHRFSPNRQRHHMSHKPQHAPKNDLMANIDLGKQTLPNFPRNNKNKFVINKQREHENEVFIPQAPSKHNPLKKPGYINNVNHDYDRHELQKINIKQEASDLSSSYPSSLSIGRPSVLPNQCGRSKIRKPPWNLKIIGGRESPINKWPWQVAILNRFKEVFCGGTLVADQWVLTAAHCLRKRLYARLAEHDLAIIDGNEVDFKVTETVPHPLYDSTTVDNDVALLRLPTPVEIGSKIAPACVPEQGSQLPVGLECTIIGWGKERHNHFFGTEVLNEAEVPIIDEDICKTVYNDYYITQNMFCAGYRRGRIDSCAGDSGGPLLCHRNGQWYIYGITSFGEGCGKRGKYGIYSKVSNYHTWINDVIAAHAHREKTKSTNQLKVEKRHNRRHARHKDYYNRRDSWKSQK